MEEMNLIGFYSFSTKDKKILESIKGDKRFDNRGFRKSTIHTIMGDVQYKKTLYKLKQKGI